MKILDKSAAELIQSFALLCLVVSAAPLAWSQMSESSPGLQDKPIVIRVSRSDTRQDIASTLFGSFLEPIGHSTYGGLWANVVENPSFEEGLWSAENLETQWNSDAELRAASSLGLPTPWEPLYPAQGSRYAPVRGDAANSAQSMLLMSLPGKEVGMLEQIYLPVQRELKYTGSLWLKHVDGNDSVKLSLRRRAHPAEVLVTSVVQAHTVPNYNNMGGALFAGGFLNAMMRNSDAVSIANMTGILEFGGIWKKRGQVYASPAYWVLRTYAKAKPRTLLRVDSSSPTFNISKGVTQLPEIVGAPNLDVVAAQSEDGRKLVLLCVNREMTRPETAVIDLSSFGIDSGPAQVTTIAGDGVLAENDEYNPDRVIAVTHTERFTAKHSYTFPSASVTVIEIPLKN